MESAAVQTPPFEMHSPRHGPLDNPVLFVVTTISRGGQGHLATVLEGLRREHAAPPRAKTLKAGQTFRRPLFAWTKVLVLNMHPYQQHDEFHAAAAAFRGESLFAFNNSFLPVVDPWYGHVREPNNKKNPNGLPGHEVRQQSADLVSALFTAKHFLLAHAPSPERGIVVLVEDDSEPCPGLFAHVRVLLQCARARMHPPSRRQRAGSP